MRPMPSRCVSSTGAHLECMGAAFERQGPAISASGRSLRVDSAFLLRLLRCMLDRLLGEQTLLWEFA